MDIHEELKKKMVEIGGSHYSENVSLASCTSFRTGGAARHVISPSSMEEAKNVFLVCRQYDIPVLVLGEGTNTLISDEGFDGVVLLTKNLNKVFVSKEQILCEAGVKISRLLKTALQHSLGGIEFLAGIPGTVGGAVVANAGLKDLWISQAAEEIYTLSPDTFEIKNIKKCDAGFGYRKSGLENFFVYRCIFNLSKADGKTIKRNIKSYMGRRISSQPVKGYSAGSIFKNPPGFFAGKLIEKAGLKKYSCGDAAISDKHANFIINKGEASSGDVYRIIKEIQKTVKKLYNVELEPEVRIIGKF